MSAPGTVSWAGPAGIPVVDPEETAMSNTPPARRFDCAS